MAKWEYGGYPPAWDTDDDEVQKPDKKWRCLNHDWVETGTKRSWCKQCTSEAVWTMDGWQEIIK